MNHLFPAHLSRSAIRQPLHPNHAMKILRWFTFIPSLLSAQATQPHLGTRGVPIIEQDGLRFRDLDRNGKLDPYEDWRLAPEVRARDLAARMTLAEKAGTMMHGTARTSGGGIPGAGAA